VRRDCGAARGAKPLAPDARKIEFVEAIALSILSHAHGISDFQKLSLTPDPNHLLNSRHPVPREGRWPSSLTLGRGAMDADALLTNGA